jgi:hypothetical protein
MMGAEHAYIAKKWLQLVCSQSEDVEWLRIIQELLFGSAKDGVFDHGLSVSK